MEAPKLKIDFVSPGPATWPHYENFTKLVPSYVQFDFQGLGLFNKSLYEITGKKAEIVGRMKELASARGWQAAILIGAPTEVMNLGLLADLQAALTIPVNTALGASVQALRRFGAEKLLLLTPFETRLNDMIVDYLTAAGFAVAAPKAFANIAEAGKLSADEVFALTRDALQQIGAVDAIYFQGAVLDPLAVLARIELELKTLAIASNPAMLWDMVSRLGRRAPMVGYGRLLAEWPTL
jgi:maleate cis-trans isomerase